MIHFFSFTYQVIYDSENIVAPISSISTRQTFSVLIAFTITMQIDTPARVRDTFGDIHYFQTSNTISDQHQLLVHKFRNDVTPSFVSDNTLTHVPSNCQEVQADGSDIWLNLSMIVWDTHSIWRNFDCRLILPTFNFFHVNVFFGNLEQSTSEDTNMSALGHSSYRISLE